VKSEKSIYLSNCNSSNKNIMFQPIGDQSWSSLMAFHWIGIEIYIAASPLFEKAENNIQGRQLL
jgi:hypothetical protein